MNYECTNTSITFHNTDCFETILDFLEHYKQSKKNRYLLLLNKQLYLNDTVVKDIHQKINGKDIKLLLDKYDIDWVIGKKPCTVLYKDDFILAVHKDAGCIIHGEENDQDCLNAQVAKYFKDNNIHTSVRPLHRLDKDTTGIVLYSLIPFFQPYLDQAMEEKKIHRAYLAITYGNKKAGACFDIHKAIGKDRHVSNKYRISSNGKDALTHVEIIEKKKNYELVRCILETGRTHQIRVHLSSNGLPIVNDPMYGKPSRDFKKMGLFAYQISFFDPVNENKINISDNFLKDYLFFDFCNNVTNKK